MTEPKQYETVAEAHQKAARWRRQSVERLLRPKPPERPHGLLPLDDKDIENGND